MNHALRFTLDYPTVGKARPQVTKNGAYFKGNYKHWKATSTTDLRSQRLQIERDWGLAFPITNPVSLYVAFWGMNLGDGDNCQGAIMDSLVRAGILQNDSFKWLPQGNWYRFPGKRGQTKWAEIVIQPALVSAKQWREWFPLGGGKAA